MKQIIEIESEKELESVVKNNKGALIIDFTSPTCGPCLMLEPIMEQLVDENICSVAKVNVLENQELARTYSITATPTLIIVKDDEIKKVVLGYQPFESWKKIIETI